MDDSAALDNALEIARDTAAVIRELERAALEALHGRNDVETYRFKLMEKCELLADLPEQVEQHLTHGGGAAGELLRGLKDFARKANQAMDLESVFYMSALLYPEDYQDGEPNDLERFLMRFQGRA
uniref:Uncharacterized protein n=1 Tax=Fundidesulfovibrio putealis TaxID=270496 RepID=A0A7C4ABD7_9BACT